MVKLGDYRHFKGTTYTVVVICKHSETLERMVVYTKYPPEPSTSAGDTPYWVRSEAMFEEEVEWPDGSVKPRFTRVDLLEPQA